MTHSYSLFKRANEHELYCAVPQNLPSPRFVRGETWEFRGALREHELRQPGFHPDSASMSVKWNGFYVFQAMPHGCNEH
jgi:hypothetical protein